VRGGAASFGGAYGTGEELLGGRGVIQGSRMGHHHAGACPLAQPTGMGKREVLSGAGAAERTGRGPLTVTDLLGGVRLTRLRWTDLDQS